MKKLTKKQNKDLAFIYAVQKEVFLLSGTYALLDWDQRTHMPKAGEENRAEQISYLYSLIHEKLTSKKLVLSLKKLKRLKLDFKDRIVVKELNKQVERLVKLPKDFVDEYSKTCVNASMVWEDARKNNDFELFKPWLAKVVELKKRQAKYLNPKLPAYDVLLDEYEEGMTSKAVSDIFKYLKNELVALLNKIKSSNNFKVQSSVNLEMSKEKQEFLAKDIIHKMGIDDNFVQLDISAHPFSTKIGFNDVRITTRFPSTFDSFTSAVHEAGHALYELGLPEEYKYTVICDAPSLGIHESQSRFWENMVVKSKFFWQGYFENFNTQLNKAFSWDEFYRSFNLVKPSFIRVNADEVTYCLHVILRFEIEKALIDGSLSVDNAKSAWNKKFEEMFGIIPVTDNDGILQDVHWSMGSFGYFPTYALGTVYSSQVLKKVSEELADFENLIKEQNFAPLLDWLRKNIHSKGKTGLADEIIKDACGVGLNPKVYVEYLTKKYSEIYHL